jgi:hypothetical protein
MWDDFTAQELPPSRFAHCKCTVEDFFYEFESINEQLSLMRDKRSEKAKLQGEAPGTVGR